MVFSLISRHKHVYSVKPIYTQSCFVLMYIPSPIIIDFPIQSLCLDLDKMRSHLKDLNKTAAGDQKTIDQVIEIFAKKPGNKFGHGVSTKHLLLFFIKLLRCCQ